MSETSECKSCGESYVVRSMCDEGRYCDECAQARLLKLEEAIGQCVEALERCVEADSRQDHIQSSNDLRQAMTSVEPALAKAKSLIEK